MFCKTYMYFLLLDLSLNQNRKKLLVVIEGNLILDKIDTGLLCRDDILAKLLHKTDKEES